MPDPTDNFTIIIKKGDETVSSCEVPRILAVMIAQGLGDDNAVKQIASDPREES